MSNQDIDRLLKRGVAEIIIEQTAYLDEIGVHEQYVRQPDLSESNLKYEVRAGQYYTHSPQQTQQKTGHKQ